MTSCDEEYGRLVEWAVNDNRHLCPVGWHVPNGMNGRFSLIFLAESNLWRENETCLWLGEDGNGSTIVAFQLCQASSLMQANATCRGGLHWTRFLDFLFRPSWAYGLR